MYSKASGNSLAWARATFGGGGGQGGEADPSGGGDYQAGVALGYPVSLDGVAEAVAEGDSPSRRQGPKLRAKDALAFVFPGENPQLVVVVDYGVRVDVASYIDVGNGQRTGGCRTTHVGLHSPPEELLVILPPAWATLVRPPGNTVTLPLPSWMAKTRRSM